MLWKGFENKSHQRRAHYLKPPKNGGQITAGGGVLRHPPGLLGLIQDVFNSSHLPICEYTPN